MRFAVVCLVAALAVGVVAVVDHGWKQRRIERLELAEWYCRHVGTRCGEGSAKVIEARWNERQLAYEVAVVGLTAAALALTARRVRRR
jgi:hypothetical protein